MSFFLILIFDINYLFCSECWHFASKNGWRKFVIVNCVTYCFFQLWAFWSHSLWLTFFLVLSLVKAPTFVTILPLTIPANYRLSSQFVSVGLKVGVHVWFEGYSRPWHRKRLCCIFLHCFHRWQISGRHQGLRIRRNLWE